LAEHSVPKCLRCGTVTPWKVGPLLRPIDIVIFLVLLKAWGGGFVYLLLTCLCRRDPDSREKVCPKCGAKNLWTFCYADRASAVRNLV
jgi:hypothetical protein